MLVLMPLHQTLHLEGTLGRQVPQEIQGFQVLLDHLDLEVTLGVLGHKVHQVLVDSQEKLEVQVKSEFKVFQETQDPRVPRALLGSEEILDREVILDHKDLKVSLRTLGVICEDTFLIDA